ncbi:hypothetical protein AAFF_G00334500 [Aldrovandia affinis]|uniref:Purine nucleoside phosphorylase LACC1 n=1 Tax=Aldrovandia affinis TaxID=143900 RepID=A0AAD7SM84_9TELE|nr:hypothetical protein AAFF_G00334500 [Aldrovandia affinis]
MAGNTEEEMRRSQFSLTETLEEVNQQGEAQAIELKRNREVVACLQATLSKVDKSSEVVQLELNGTERMIHSLADDMVQLQKRTCGLQSESQEIYMENMKLQIQIEEEEDNCQLVLAGYNMYRNKMESYKMAISKQESQTAVHRELVEKRATVNKLTKKREDLRADLQNPAGNVLRKAQNEIDGLRVQIYVMEERVRDRTQLLVKEQETHAQLRKDIEIQSRRCEAILKRLRCQLHKAQSNHRQLTDDICCLEKEAVNEIFRITSAGEKMSMVVIVDLFHSHCPEYNDCLQKRIKKVSAVVCNGKYGHVYFMLQTRDQMNASGLGDTVTAQLEELIQLNDGTRVLEHSSLAASLYCFKQAVDELDQRAVLVLTSTQRIDELQAYQDQLFTALYSFEYTAAFDECPAGAAIAPSGSCVKDQVAIFLRQLPALKGEISILRSSLISDCFSHGFTTRTGGISYIPTLGSLNLFSSSRRRDPRAVVAENIRRLGLQAGFDPEKFHLVKTNHASDLWVMGKPPPESYDGIVTNQSGVIIAAPGADCMPLVFTDPVAKVIGVAHAGWKGTLMGIAVATVNAMVTEFGSELTDIVAVIGPSVGPCCFSLEKESAEAFHAIHPRCVRDRGSAMPYVDIRLATRILLQRGGLLPHHIQDNTVTDRPNLTLCTACLPDSFFSHVRDGNNFGTQIGFLWIKE